MTDAWEAGVSPFFSLIITASPLTDRKCQTPNGRLQVCPCGGVSSSCEKGRSPDSCHGVGEAGKPRAEREKPDATGRTSCDSIHQKVFGLSKYIDEDGEETGGRLGPGSAGGMGSDC